MNTAPKKYDQLVEEKKTVNGQTYVVQYSKGKFLGKGGFAKCYEFTNISTNQVIAAKIVSKDSLTRHRAKQKLMSEIKIHRSLHNSGIVHFESFFEDAENVFILLELCQNQTLNELLRRRKKLTDFETQCFMMQLVQAVKYLHDNKVIHRDLKLGNLFLTDKMELKVGDFGLATKVDFDGEKKRTICGTPNYIAPEILEGKCGHSYEVDIWSLGVIFYTLLIGKPPFETADVKTTYKKIKMNSYNFPESSPISSLAKNLIQSILNTDPKKRPTLADIASNEYFAFNIPKTLPTSCLACPPSYSYMRQFGHTCSKEEKMKMEEVAAGAATSRPVLSGNNNLMNTERVRVASAASKCEIIKTKQCDELPDVFITKWVDYSSKYGLGYILSNGLTGVFFNDATKIAMKKDKEHFDYIEKIGSDRADTPTLYSVSQYPSALQKKVMLLQHFKGYLEGELSKNENSKIPIKVATESSAYVKKWMKTKHAILFRLSNKVVQVNFLDLTQIILFSEHKTIAYTNKKNERTVLPLSVALQSNNCEMTKRLKYTKEILTHMVGQGSSQKEHTNEPSPMQSG
jgi:polo-like kinase 1